MSTGHHIVSVKMCLTIYSLLLVFTAITLGSALLLDFGFLNFSIAMLIATVKASFVMFYFMGLKFDSTENRMIFFSSILFVAIFIALTYSDVLFRKGGSYVPTEDIVGAKEF